MATVVIDPGHGGTTAVGGSSANNAIGPAGTLEKTLTLDVGRRVRDVLAGQGHTVLMTRNADNNLGLAARAHVARDNHAAAFVSIHFNASVPHNAQGTETWIHTSHSTASNRLATRVQASTQDATGLNDRGVKAGGFGVINPSSHWSGTAACLVEISFMDRADEETRLQNTTYRDASAAGIAQGITAYLALAPVDAHVIGMTVGAPPAASPAYEDAIVAMRASTKRGARRKKPAVKKRRPATKKKKLSKAKAPKRRRKAKVKKARRAKR